MAEERRSSWPRASQARRRRPSEVGAVFQWLRVGRGPLKPEIGWQRRTCIRDAMDPSRDHIGPDWIDRGVSAT